MLLLIGLGIDGLLVTGSWFGVCGCWLVVGNWVTLGWMGGLRLG